MLLLTDKHNSDEINHLTAYYFSIFFSAKNDCWCNICFCFFFCSFLVLRCVWVRVVEVCHNRNIVLVNFFLLFVLFLNIAFLFSHKKTISQYLWDFVLFCIFPWGHYKNIVLVISYFPFFPASEIPSSCEELLSIDRTLPSATYWLRIEGVRVRIFCHFGLDSKAAMYIPLVTNNKTNYAYFFEILQPYTCDDSILATLTTYATWDLTGYTLFNRVRLKLNEVRLQYRL